MMSSVTFLSKKVFTKLLTEMHNGIPNLLSEIASNGYQENLQYFLQHRALRTAFDEYEGKMTFEEYKANYKRPTMDPAEDMSRLILQVFNNLVFNGYLVNEKSGQRHQFEPMEDRLANLQASFLLGYGISADSTAATFAMEYVGAQVSAEIDYPLFEYIFEILKSNGLAWQYYNPALLLAARIAFGENSDESPSEVSVFQLVIDQIKMEVPPNIMVAYFDVYAKWPDGYPPKIEDYKYF